MDDVWKLVKLKPLEWSDLEPVENDNVCRAQTPFGTYEAARDGWMLLGCVDWVFVHGMDAAKAAAEADYEARIYVALTPSPSAHVEGLREAAGMFHQEQTIVWVQDIVEGLGFADVLKIDSYDDNIAAHEVIEVGLIRIRDAILARAADLEGKTDD